MPRLLQPFRFFFPPDGKYNSILSLFFPPKNLFNTCIYIFKPRAEKSASELCQHFQLRSYRDFNISQNVKFTPIFFWLVSSKDSSNFLKGKRGGCVDQLVVALENQQYLTVINRIRMFLAPKKGLALSYTIVSKNVEISSFSTC